VNSWTDPQTLTALIGAFVALVTAIGATWHTINTRKVANAAQVRAGNASINALRAVSIATTPVAKTPGTVTTTVEQTPDKTS
jgi:hypothetical protein